MVRGVTPGKRTPGKSKARRLQDLTTSFKQTKHPNLLRGNKHVAYRTSVNGVKKKASKERKQILGLLQKAQKVAERDPMLCKVKSDWFKKLGTLHSPRAAEATNGTVLARRRVKANMPRYLL
jgi:hypothetical protein